jgi:rhodanese-related sulfurtransferase
METGSGFGNIEAVAEIPRKYVPPPLELVKGRIEELMPPDAEKEIEGGGVVLVDVRNPERYEAGHLAGAVSVPSGESAREAHEAAYGEAIEKAGAGPEDRLILYCGEGNRSARTADALRNEHGFSNVASIIGGAKLWSDLGYPVEGEIAVGAEEAETDLEGEEDTT